MNPTARKIKDYLDASSIHYWTGDSAAPTANLEQTRSISTSDGILFCLLVTIAGKPAIVALSSNEDFDVQDLQSFLHTEDVKVLGEAEYQKWFPDCEATALPALGSAFGMPVYCSPQVLQKRKICFNSGTHDECIQLATNDFIDLTHPVVGTFTQSAANSIKAICYW
jgi:Ala-tRNA(Pro) deacylase